MPNKAEFEHECNNWTRVPRRIFRECCLPLFRPMMFGENPDSLHGPKHSFFSLVPNPPLYALIDREEISTGRTILEQSSALPRTTVSVNAPRRTLSTGSSLIQEAGAELPGAMPQATPPYSRRSFVLQVRDSASTALCGLAPQCA